MRRRRNSKPPVFAPALGWCTLLVLLLGTPQARSESQGLHFNASLSANVTDNVNNAPAGEKSDFFFTYAPEIEWGRRLAAGSFSVSGGVTGYVYAKEDRLTRIYADLNASLDIEATDRLSFTLSDRFVPAALQYSNTDDEPTNIAQANTANLLLTYSIPLRGAWSAALHPGVERYDVLDWHDVFDPGEEPDRTDVLAGGLLERQMGKRSKITFEANYRATFFDNESTVPVNPLINPLFNHSTLGGSLSWSYRPRRQFEISAGGGVAGFFQAAGSDVTGIWKAGIHWYPSTRTDIGVDTGQNYSTQLDGAFFRVTNIKFGALHKFTRRLEASFDLLFVFLNGDDLGTQDDTDLLSLSPALAYNLGKHFKVKARYEHGRRKSPLPSDEFTRNVGSLTLAATF